MHPPSSPAPRPRPRPESHRPPPPLTQERKDLIAGNYRDKHWQWSSMLLAGGVAIAIEGCLNTFMRTGKLFPGPHLFAGACVTHQAAAQPGCLPAPFYWLIVFLSFSCRSFVGGLLLGLF